MKDFGHSFSAETRIRASGFVVFSSRVFLRSSGGLGVQAASGAGWERAARSHGGVENTTLRSFRSDPALQNQKILSLTFPSTVSPSMATDRYSRRILIRRK